MGINVGAIAGSVAGLAGLAGVSAAFKAMGPRTVPPDSIGIKVRSGRAVEVWDREKRDRMAKRTLIIAGITAGAYWWLPTLWFYVGVGAAIVATIGWRKLHPPPEADPAKVKEILPGLAPPFPMIPGFHKLILVRVLQEAYTGEGAGTTKDGLTYEFTFRFVTVVRTAFAAGLNVNDRIGSIREAIKAAIGYQIQEANGCPNQRLLGSELTRELQNRFCNPNAPKTGTVAENGVRTYNWGTEVVEVEITSLVGSPATQRADQLDVLVARYAQAVRDNPGLNPGLLAVLLGGGVVNAGGHAPSAGTNGHSNGNGHLDVAGLAPLGEQ